MGSEEIISAVYCLRGFVRISNRPWGAFGWTKVWPLTVMAKAIIYWKGGGRQFQKIIDLLEEQINDLSLGKRYSLPILPATPSPRSRTL